MPRKSARRIVARKKQVRKKITKIKSRKLVFVFLSCAVVILLASIGLKLLDSKPFCANSTSCIKDLSGRFDPDAKTGTFGGKIVKVPSQEALAYTRPEKNVLGESTGHKKIGVDLSRQHLYAYEGDQVIMDFPVSTGKWHYTPTGTFNIWVKLRYTGMEGGSGADYYNLPNVPYTMFFSGPTASRSDGYSIHGAYWHNNFGHPMSHGCVNMRIADAGQIFAWADPPTSGWSTPATASNPGTEVVIYGETPKE